jgi:aryl-alcohol dehydrogenase-like predicted oxidoreductase
MAGSVPIGWGDADDATSIAALERARGLGITFFDTADFYGLGHSEELLGRTFGNRDDVIIATKVGHRLNPDSTIALDYSRRHIHRSCDESLKRLRRQCIDYYQLHSARLAHLERGECIRAMEDLRQQGKIRYWGLSLNTFHPGPEAEFMIQGNIGDGFQLVLNIINQRALSILPQAAAGGYGIIARMPLQFGLLAGKFSEQHTFPARDHRHTRLPPEFLPQALDALRGVWEIADRLGAEKSSLALSFCLGFPEVSTVIPGIRTPAQAESNVRVTSLSPSTMNELKTLYTKRLRALLERMEHLG